MRRREFITLVGGAAAWPLATSGQQADRVRHIGVLGFLAEEDQEVAGRASPRSVKRSQVWAGPRGATFISITAGREAMPIAFANMPRNWLRSPQMSYSAKVVRPLDRCWKRLAPFQSSS